MAVRRLTVSGNCQRNVAAHVLGLLLPDAEVSVVNNLDDGGYDTIRASDLWVRVIAPGAPPLAEMMGSDAPETVFWPNITFDAFHPDITYVKHPDGDRQSLFSAYHSMIGFWAWKRGRSAREAEELFTPATCEALGYLDAWERAEAHLAQVFADVSLDFEEFRLSARRLGVFMHTINHPRVDVLALVARQVVRKIDPAGARWDEAIFRYLHDGLIRVIWPVYPPIAEYLGVPGSYRWKENLLSYADLRAFLAASWEVYAPLDPAQLIPFLPGDSRFATLERLYG